jgi:hypothetical protein
MSEYYSDEQIAEILNDWKSPHHFEDLDHQDRPRGILDFAAYQQDVGNKMVAIIAQLRAENAQLLKEIHDQREVIGSETMDEYFLRFSEGE